jgi:hypothetical protein
VERGNGPLVLPGEKYRTRHKEEHAMRTSKMIMLAAGLGMSVLLLSGNSFSADKTMPEMKKKMPEAEMMQDDAAAMPQPCGRNPEAWRNP